MIGTLQSTQAKTLFFNLTISKKHVNLHVEDLSTHTRVTIRDAGLIPALQHLLEHLKKVGEKTHESATYYALINNKLKKWDYISYKAFLSNEEVRKLLPEVCYAETKKIQDLL